MARKQEIDFQSRLEFHKSLRLVIKSLALVLVVFLVSGCIYLTGREFAGRSSLADMTFRLVATAEANKPVALIVAYVFAFLSGSYGLAQRTLRRRYIQKWSPILAELEQTRDPKRTSSQITKRGTTRREDQ